jgi:tripeptidyl-peptidase-2
MSTKLIVLGMLQSEYPKYTPLLAKILECVLRKANGDKIGHEKEVTAI